jgi:hypothetical protein
VLRFIACLLFLRPIFGQRRATDMPETAAPWSPPG